MEKIIHFEEFFERDEPKSRVYQIVDNIINSLNLPSHFKIVDAAVGQEGASQELATQFIKYGEQLKGREMGEKNSFLDVGGNLQISLIGLTERANKKGLNEFYKEKISNDFETLKEYLDLLNSYKKFEKAELTNENGFLGFFIGKKEDKQEKNQLQEIRRNKAKYVQHCKKILEMERP